MPQIAVQCVHFSSIEIIDGSPKFGEIEVGVPDVLGCVIVANWVSVLGVVFRCLLRGIGSGVTQYDQRRLDVQTTEMFLT